MSHVLGIVGGGQLARMIALDAVRLGVQVIVLAGESDEGVRGLFPVLNGAHDNPDALRRLADQVDVVTFDHELVPLAAIRDLEEDGVVVHPSSTALAFADKLHQRTSFARAGLPVPPFAAVDSIEDVEAFSVDHGWPVMLKAPRGGYDGRGVAVAQTVEEAQGMLDAAAGRGLLIEPLLELWQELAVLVVTSADGDRVVYDPVESVQVEGMCREIHSAVGHLPAMLEEEARTLGAWVADVVGAVGVLAVELFVVSGPDGEAKLLVNEIAPRPHNSGHHTIDACVTSQFENHARAVLGLPLGSVTQVAPVSVMVNIVGTDAGGDPRGRLGLAPPQAKIHLYEKTPRPKRKIGHVTVLGQDHDEVAGLARRAAATLEGT